MEDERGAEASRPCARPQPLHRARRQHLFPGQDRRDRRQELPADGGLHDRHDGAGIPRHDDQGRPKDRGKPEDRRARRRSASPEGRLTMARNPASLSTPHIPAFGAAFDLGKTKEDYWKPVFAGYDFDKQWVKTHKPDVIFLVYNDHATAFSLQM